MGKRLKHILFSGCILALLICLFSFSASAFTYSGSVNDVDISTFQVTIGNVTLPLEEYPDGDYFPLTSPSVMTASQAAKYGITAYSDISMLGSQCVGFARYVYTALYYRYPANATIDPKLGYKHNGYSYAYRDMVYEVFGTTTLSGFTQTQFETLIKSCYPGSLIRAGGHTMVIMAIFNDGFIVYDANFSTDYDNVIDIRKYTWSTYMSKMGSRIIEAVHMPSYYPGYTYSTGSTGGGAYDYDLDTTRAGTYEVVNVSSYLNVRSAPSSSGSIVGKVYAGDVLEVLGTYNGWAAVEYNGAACWMSLEYLEVIALNVVIDGYTLDTSTAGAYQINSPYVGYLNVRDLPTTSSTKMGSLKHNSVIQILGTYDGWAAFVYNDEYCWCSTDYLVAYVEDLTVTVTFDPNGGTNEYDAMEYEIGSAFDALPIPTKSNRTFVGWYNGTTLYTKDSIVPSSDLTLTAKWGIAVFNDVVEGDWYATATEFVYNNSVMTGTSGTTFEPNTNLTRASAAQIIYNLAGRPKVSSTEETFPDVRTSDWFYKAVEWAADNGLVTGDGNGYFNPNDYITRQDFAVVLWRYATNYANMDTTVSEDFSLSSFPDASDVSGYAQEAMRWAVSNGLINGMVSADGSVTSLSPKYTATRAMIAKIMMVYVQS